MGETRYSSLKKAQPEVADKLFALSEKENAERLAKYQRLAEKKD